MKVVENFEEPFKKDTTTYYVQNPDDNRSRKDNWKAKSFVRSDSHPRFLRTASKNTYVRDNSRFSRQGSNFRANSRTGSNARSGSFVKQTGIPRSQSKSLERLKSEMFTKVEKLEKEFEQFEKSQNEIKEILKKKLISTQFVEEEIVIDVKYGNEGQERMLLIDSSVPK